MRRTCTPRSSWRGGVARTRTAGRADVRTKVPRPGSREMSPADSRRARTERMVIGATPKSAARRVWGGSCAPGSSSPERMRSCKRSKMRPVRGPKSWIISLAMAVMLLAL